MKTGVFKAGQLKTSLSLWQTITTISDIPIMVQGCNIEFDEMPYQDVKPTGYEFSKDKSSRIGSEVQGMITKGDIAPVSLVEGSFVFNTETTIIVHDKSQRNNGIYLADMLGMSNQVVLGKHAKSNTVQFEYDRKLPKEAYRLHIEKDNIEISVKRSRIG